LVIGGIWAAASTITATPAAWATATTSSIGAAPGAKWAPANQSTAAVFGPIAAATSAAVGPTSTNRAPVWRAANS
jgi:hypothetical protein